MLHGGFAGLRTHKIQIEIVKDPIDFRRVIRKHNKFQLAPVPFVSDRHIEEPMPSRLFGKLLAELDGDLKEFERTLLLEHPHQPGFSACLFLIPEHGVSKHGKVFCRESGQLEGDLRSLQRKPDNLISGVVSEIQSASSFTAQRPAGV